MRMRIAVGMCVGLFASLPAAVGAFDDEDTHPRVTERAARAASVDEMLRRELDLTSGIETPLSAVGGARQTILRWLRAGAIEEDHPTCRASNHFHNPLKPFPGAGVTDQPALIQLACRDFRPVQSSATWGTAFVSPWERGPGTANPFDWDAARAAFLESLIASAAVDREAALARTFEALGHGMHLVQDLAVPAHVRNDFQSHLVFFPKAGPFTRWFENEFERYVRLRPELVDGASAMLAGSADRPVTRFWDTDQYTGENPTGDLAQGLAEYTNANYVSRNTVLTEALDASDPHAFPYPRQSSTNLPALFPHAVAVSQVSAEDGQRDTGLYLSKTGDGETIERFLKVGYLGLEAAAAAPGAVRLTLQLDDAVHAEFAARLLPRAIGYSAGFLDHFFRGRLDVDLVDDGGALRLEGGNGSPESLGGGSLAVYADGPDGRVTAGTATVAGAGAGAALPPVPVAPPEGAERFVAVYAGALGEERPGATSPGAVIGKVLGGYRVEQLVSDGTRWNVRTPHGVFPLPISRTDIVDLRWGDADNTLVGRTAFGAGQANRLKAYRINRPAGSVDVPLRAVPEGGQEVDLQATAEAAFPLGLSAGTLVLDSTIDYEQYLISFLHTIVTDEGSNVVSDTYSDGRIERVVSDSVRRTFVFDLALDLQRFNTFSARPYLWQLQQIGLTADGRLLALVRLRLTQLDPGQPGSVALFPSKRFAWCGEASCAAPPDVEDGPPAAVPFGFGRGAANHWVLVDVSRGRVIHSSAAGGVVIRNVIQETRFRDGSGGPFNGLAATEVQLRITPTSSSYPVDPDANLRFGTPCSGEPGTSFRVGQADLRIGVPVASVTQYRAELENVAFPPYAERLPSRSNACLPSRFGPSPAAYVAVEWDEARVYLNDAVAAARVPDGSERLVLLFELPQALATGFSGNYARVVRWDPPAETAALRHEALTGDLWQLVTSARDLAVITGSNTPALTVVPLAGSQLTTAYAMPLGQVFGFRGLSPAFLYNVQDQRFYRYAPDLRRTALPRALAPGGGTTGDHHAIRLR